jgi:WD40 repeat protein
VQVVSCDVKGFIKYWDAETFRFPSTGLQFKSMFQTNLMDCVKMGCMVKHLSVSRSGEWLAVSCSDFSVRVLAYSTGKLKRIFHTDMKVCSTCVFHKHCHVRRSCVSVVELDVLFECGSAWAVHVADCLIFKHSSFKGFPGLST